MFKNDHHHQVAGTAFQWALEYQIDNSFVSLLSDVMRRNWLDFRRINLGYESFIGIIDQKISEYQDAPEHFFDEGINVVARLFRFGFHEFHGNENVGETQET